MDIRKVKKLMEMLEESSLSELEVIEGEESIRLSKSSNLTTENITNQLEKKIEALSAYISEIREWPHSRSIKGIESQASFRGMQSGFCYSEAFVLLRELVI